MVLIPPKKTRSRMNEIASVAVLSALLVAKVAHAAGDGSISSVVEINSTTPNGPVLADFDQFGMSIANIGDLNGDGVDDLAVGMRDKEGGSYRGGIQILFMNDDGSVDSTVAVNDATANGPVLSDNDNFGWSVAGIGDLNGDGVNDIAVGAYGDDEGGTNRGAIHILFMNTDGSVDSTVEINSSTTNGPVLANNAFLGWSIANIGDLNGDGVNDIAAGVFRDNGGGYGRGGVNILFMNTDGSVDSTVKIDDTIPNGPVLADSDRFGSSVANIGDLNGDGVNDIAVGATSDSSSGNGHGAVHILFMNTDGSVDSTVKINGDTTNGPILDEFDRFGKSIAGIGDLNGDGVVDIVVGTYGNYHAYADYQGAVNILFMNTDGSVSSTLEINSGTANGPVIVNYDYFGRSIAGIGDLNGDGIVDFAVGARGDDAGGDLRGTVHILFMADVDTTAPTISTLSPADNATNVAIDTNLVITFDEPVVASSTGNVVIHKASDDSIVATIPADDDQVTIDDDEVTINPTADLSEGTAYYIRIDTGAFEDEAGNPFAGISNTTTWNFTTVAAEAEEEDDDTPAPPLTTSTSRRSSDSSNSAPASGGTAPAGSVEALMTQLISLLQKLLEQLIAERGNQ